MTPLAKALSYLTLYGAHALKVFSFILLIPTFTRIFPRTVWGEVLTVQALALWLQIVVEYGFNLSATRSMARVRDDDAAIGGLVSGVVGAKAALSGVVVVLAVASTYTLSNVQVLGSLVAWATVFALVQGFNPVWYFLARGRFGQYAAIDFCTRLGYLALCLSFIRGPGQAHLIFGFGILSGLIANGVGYLLISRQVPLSAPTVRASVQALREGFSLFVFVGVTSVYTTLNIVILGFSQTTAVVAAYGTSDRLVKAAGGLLDPLNRVIYARLSHLYNHDFRAALRFLRRAAAALLLGGAVIFGVGELLAPEIVHVLAPNYTDSVIFLRLLLLYIPVLAVNNLVGLHVMLPLGLDREFNGVFLSVSLLSFAAMLLLVPVYGPKGMAWIMIVTELLAAVGMGMMTWRSGILHSRSEGVTKHA